MVYVGQNMRNFQRKRRRESRIRGFRMILLLSVVAVVSVYGSHQFVSWSSWYSKGASVLVDLQFLKGALGCVVVPILCLVGVIRVVRRF